MFSETFAGAPPDLFAASERIEMKGTVGKLRIAVHHIRSIRYAFDASRRTADVHATSGKGLGSF